MTKQETMAMLAVFNASYPRFAVTNQDSLDMMVDIWQKSFSDTPYALITAAVQKLLYELQFPPTIADVAKRLADINAPHLLNDSEAYEEMIFAVGKYGWCHQQEAMDSLAPLTRKIVNQMGYLDICKSENDGTLRAQFRMAYQAEANEIKQNALLPEKFKLQIGINGKGNLLTDGAYPAQGEVEDLVKKYSNQLEAGRVKQIEPAKKHNDIIE